MANDDLVFTGGCLCGAARFQVKGPPIRAAYCHCTLCQRQHSAAFVHTVHWDASAFNWGLFLPEEILDSYATPQKPWKMSWRCKTCGVGIANENTKKRKWAIWGTLFDRGEDGKIKNWEVMKPTSHWFYDTRILDVNDDLSKWLAYEDESERLG
ncbi:hypothetical protein D9611_005129 [Ephemerocybe angulata]|uniref:CENP-V/GFA domain-containing protein n=1 Tax=Ephemerocybe angulata TaxID=980116 RepID=A0A8H5BZQ1_9AGAR|nr:hypothetical protein D9611_005129 [Tulosesus angulatus]